MLALLLSACSSYRPPETVRIKPYEDDSITAFARSADGSLYWFGQNRIYTFAAREAACFEPMLPVLNQQQTDTNEVASLVNAQAELQTETNTIRFSYTLAVPNNEMSIFNRIPTTAGCEIVADNYQITWRQIRNIGGTLLSADSLPPYIQKTALAKPQRMTFHTVRLATAEERQQQIDDYRQKRAGNIADTALDILKLPFVLPFALPALLNGSSIGSKGAGK